MVSMLSEGPFKIEFGKSQFTIEVSYSISNKSPEGLITKTIRVFEENDCILLNRTDNDSNHTTTLVFRPPEQFINQDEGQVDFESVYRLLRTTIPSEGDPAKLMLKLLRQAEFFKRTKKFWPGFVVFSTLIGVALFFLLKNSTLVLGCGSITILLGLGLWRLWVTQLRFLEEQIDNIIGDKIPENEMQEILKLLN